MTEFNPDTILNPGEKWVRPATVREGWLETIGRRSDTPNQAPLTWRLWTPGPWIYVTEDDFSECDRPLMADGAKVVVVDGLLDRRGGQRSHVIVYRIVRDGSNDPA